MRLSLDDALALAAALDAQLAHMIGPDGVTVMLAPKLVVDGADVRTWVRSKAALSPAARRTFYAGALVPESELEGEYGAGGLTVYGAASLAVSADITTKGEGVTSDAS